MTTLYKTNKNGSIQQWSIEVSGATFISTRKLDASGNPIE